MANPIDDLEPDRINLLICKQCKDIKEVPYWKGGKVVNASEGKYDQTDNPWLEGAIGKCGPEGHYGILTDCLTVAWMGNPKLKEEILDRIKKQILGGGSSGLDILGTNFYAVKDTYSADAMSCWKIHNSPKGQCPDYKSDRKELKPDTAKERKDIGLTATKTKIHLCDFCPVKMYNQKRAYEARGLYN
jgi:hypothetical protein